MGSGKRSYCGVGQGSDGLVPGGPLWPGGRKHLMLGVSVLALGLSGQTHAEDWLPRLDDLSSGDTLQFDLSWGQMAQAVSPDATEQQFDIPAGDLQSALVAFSQAAGFQLLYPAEVTAGLQTQGVQGLFTPQQALDRLIAGTGLAYRFTDASTVTLVRAPPQDAAVPVRLDPVTVTGARFPTRISELPASITVLDEENLDAQPTFQRDAVGGLASVVPGINITSPLGSAATLRGREVSFRINNIEINQRYRPTGNSIFDLPAAAFGRVEVVRGADATFGFGASGGAVNFRTPEPVPGEAQFETTLGLSFQPTDFGDSLSPEFRQSVTGSISVVDYWFELGGEVNGTLFDPEGDPLPDSDSSFPNSEVIDVNASLVLNIDDDQRLTTSHFFVNTSQDPEFVAIADGDPDTGRKTSTAPFTSFGDVFEDSFRRQYIGTAGYENDDIFGNRLDLTFFYQDRALRQIPGELAPSQIIQLREDNQRLGVRLNVETPLDFLDNSWVDGATLTWGADLQRFIYESEETLAPDVPFQFNLRDATETSRAVFAQLRIPFLDDFLITGGVRYEDTEIDLGSESLVPLFGGDFEGGTVEFDQALFNAGIVYFLNDEIEIYGSFSQAADILDIARAVRLPQIRSADDIRPEPATTDQFELGFRANWPRLQASAAVFYSESELANQLTLVPGTVFAAPVRRPQEIWGAEITLDTQPFDDWGFGGNLSFSDGVTDLENGETVDLGPDTIQPLRFTGYVEYMPLPDWRNRIQVSHQVSADGSRELDTFDVDALTFVDFYSEARFGPGRLQLSVENLFNTTEFNPTAQINRDGVLGRIANVPFPGTTVGLRFALNW